MSAGWDRVESMIHSVDLTDGLAAPIGDPLWMLARQRQVGEFHGDDAAQPVAIRVRGRSATLATYRPGAADAGGPVAPFPGGAPLEAVVESAGEATFGSAGAHASARASRRLLRLLRQGDVPPAAMQALRAAFPPAVATDLGVAGEPAARVLARWSFDATALAAATAERLDAALAELDASTRRAVTEALTQWRAWYARTTPAGESSWDDEKLEYSFSVAAPVDDGELVLSVSAYPGGRLDWFSCDLTPGSHGLPAQPATPVGAVALPTPVRYPGMPASRWWEFEDNAVNFGDVSAGPADLARLVLTEFATIFSNDWFVVPLRIPLGTLTELHDVTVVDTFGGVTEVPSVAWSDHRRVGAARSWRLYELSGDAIGPAHRAPWLYLAPTLGTTLDGPVLERVTFTRDEAANLAWGVEQLIEGPLGRAVHRHDAWRRPTTVPSTPTTMDDAWTYRIGGEAPPWWIPFLPERTGGAQVRFRRARLPGWALLDAPDQAGPRSQLLDLRGPRRIAEHRVPTGGVQVERAWQLARWTDGSLHLWLQRRIRPGRGDRGSGLRYDVIDRDTAQDDGGRVSGADV